MPLPPVVDSLDRVPESVREFYTEQDGTFVLDTDVDSHPKVSGLKSAFDKTKDELKGLKGRYKDIDPEEFQRLREEAQKAQEKRAREEGDFKSLEKQLREHYAKEIEAREGRIGTLSKTLEARLIDAEATAAIAAADGVPKLLLPHMKHRIRTTEVDGEWKVEVLNAEGEPWLKDGRPATMADLVEDFRADAEFGRAFRSSGNGGSGAGVGASSGGSGRKSLKDMTDKEKMDFIDANGLDAYRKLLAGN